MKKKLVVAATAGALTLAAGSAFALENEFHGMYKFMGFEGNFFSGVSNGLSKDSHSGWFAEQRARINYIAKANDNLKLVTHFELDARFGGKSTALSSTGAPGGYLGTYSGNDSGNLDADQLTLETKSIYLDFNCPITGTNMKVGLQPWADSYQSLFLLADMTGVYATKKFDAFTGSLGWFRFDDNTLTSHSTTVNDGPGQLTADLFVLDGKFAINKDMKVGGSYYFVNRDTFVQTPATQSARGDVNSFDYLHMFGLNADLTFGPATVKPFVAYQMGEISNTLDTSGFLAGATAKIKAGPGAVNLSAIYLSGDDSPAVTSDQDSFKIIAPFTSYFNAGNMWLLLRNGQMINSSTSVLANDITVNGRGLMGVFAGYEGTADKIFYNANIGYAATAEERWSEDGSIGTEINAQVGYKLFDNLSVSVAGAYAILGDGLSKTPATATNGTKGLVGLGVNDADDPWMLNTQLSYTF